MTREDFDRALEVMFKKREPKPEPKVRTVFDFEAAARHGIGFYLENGVILMSGSGMKKAKELGVLREVED